MTIQITKITDEFSTAPQINVEDIAEIAQLGFKTIINNRPDVEGGDEQPTSVQLKAKAEALGLAYVHIPVVPNNILPHQIEAFASAYNFATKPVLGFCRTGNRAGNMFRLSQSNSGQKNTAPKGLVAWFKSKCLITRVWRWYKTKYPIMNATRSCCK
ncbi:MAG: TIGR01244 family sulfur transferase [Methylophilaceae bacterium]